MTNAKLCQVKELENNIYVHYARRFLFVDYNYDYDNDCNDDVYDYDDVEKDDPDDYDYYDVDELTCSCV